MLVLASDVCGKLCYSKSVNMMVVLSFITVLLFAVVSVTTLFPTA